MTQEDANEIARVQKLTKAIITSDGSVYKNADPVAIKKHCEDQGLKMFQIGYGHDICVVTIPAETEEQPSKSKKDNGVK